MKKSTTYTGPKSDLFSTTKISRHWFETPYIYIVSPCLSQFLKLQGKPKRGKEEINFLEVNTADFISTAEVTKSLSEEQDHRSHKKKDMPSSQQKRKHQIGYLAFQVMIYIHCDNMPMQYTAIFTAVKNENFQLLIFYLLYPPQTVFVGGYTVFTLFVRLSVRPSVRPLRFVFLIT